MAQSTGGMAVLVLLSMLLVTVNATLTLQLGWIVFTGGVPGVTAVDVEGVATVQVGGTNPPSYYIDCFTTAPTSTDLRWSRETGQLTVGTEQSAMGVGLRLLLEQVEHGELGVYVCTDTNTGEEARVNVTDANPAVCPVVDMVTTAATLSAQLDVYVGGIPVPTADQIHWYRPNGVEIMDGDENVRFANSRKRLILSNIQQSDAGTYDVEVVQQVLLSTRKARNGIDLIVHFPPVIISQPITPVLVIERQPLSLSCTVSGNPVPSITWEKVDGSPLNPLHMVPPPPDSPNSIVTSTLTIPSSLYTDMGQYQCIARNAVSLHPVSSSFSEVTVRPVLTLSAMNTATNQPIEFSDVISQPFGSEFTVTCVGSGDLEWTSSTGSQILSNESGDPFQVLDITMGHLRLTFRNFSVSQRAVYTCDSPLKYNGAPITESVFITDMDPAVFITPTELFVLEGDTASIEAGVSASSSHTVQWFRNGIRVNIDSDPHFSQTVENSLYTLTISDINSQRLGEYTVMVTLDSDSSSASDTVNVTYSSPPNYVSVSTSQQTVDEGGEVRVQCQGDGVGEVTVRWFFAGSGLPSGVTQDGTDLYISSANRAHNGVYQCQVANRAGIVNGTVAVTVNYPPFSVITYNLISSTSNQMLLASFSHGNNTPNFICSSEGIPTPQISWRKAGGFPNNVGTQSHGTELVWGRTLEYSDSGQYECVSENRLGTSVATLQLTVHFVPIINSVYSSIYVERSPTGSYLIPTGFTGIAITCGAFGSPPPLVEWLYQGGSLPNGVQSITPETSESLSQSARLVFPTGYSSSHNGQYQCVVRESGSSSPTDTQSIQVTEGGAVTTPTPPPSCSVSSSQTNFQLRVLDIDCTSWTDSLKETIRSAVEDKISSIVQIECNCTVGQNAVLIPNRPVCSTRVENGAVFRGTIETSSAGNTEAVFCALSRWQQMTPSVNINNQRFQVDPECSLQLTSFSDPECVPGPPDNTILIAIIAGSVGGALLLILVVFIPIICCVCRQNRRKTVKIERSGQVGPTSPPGGESLYQQLNHGSYRPSTSSLYKPYPVSTTGNSSPHSHRPLEIVGSGQSRDVLLPGDRESLDGGDIQYLHTDAEMDTAMSTGHIVGVTLPDMKQFPYSSESGSGTSSRVTSPPQRPPARSVISATNPIPDYEQLDETYIPGPHHRPSRTESLGVRKFSEGNNSPSMGTSTGPYSVLERDEIFSTNSNPVTGFVGAQGTASLRIFNRESLDAPRHGSSTVSSTTSKPSQASVTISEEPRRGSDCSEDPPPYSSRPPSELTPSTSMLDNSAYGRVEHTPPVNSQDDQWYMNDNDSPMNNTKSNRQFVRGPNGRTIHPYAMTHNSAIPYTPTTITTQQSESTRQSPQISQTRMFRGESRKHSTPQPYSEPIQSSLGDIASESSFHSTPKFETIVV